MEVVYYYEGNIIKRLGEALSGCLPVAGELVSIAVNEYLGDQPMKMTYTGRVAERNFVYGERVVVHIHLA